MFQIIFTIIGVFLSVLMTKLISQNGKVLKRMEEGFKMMGEKMDEGFRRMDEGFRLIALLILAETPGEKKELARKILREKQ